MVGPNGAGKTNLLEGIHAATQGFSPRTRAETQLINHAAPAARATAVGEVAGVGFEATVTLRRAGGKELQADGVEVTSDALRARFPVLVFTPDRLAIVKGGPAVRRTYLDRMLGRGAHEHAQLPGRYSQALAQRNAALRRVRSGHASAATVAPWTEAVASLGSRLEAERARIVSELAPAFAAAADGLGLGSAQVDYEAAPVTVELLGERLAQDVERGTTGLGPHLRDVTITAAGRDLRSYGSQGQQRLGVLALVLAEARAVAARTGETPVLLLDDVLSELDVSRRERLLAELPTGAQSVITATSADALPAQVRAADHVVEVESSGVAVTVHG